MHGATERFLACHTLKVLDEALGTNAVGVELTEHVRLDVPQEAVEGLSMLLELFGEGLFPQPLGDGLVYLLLYGSHPSHTRSRSRQQAEHQSSHPTRLYCAAHPPNQIKGGTVM